MEAEAAFDAFQGTVAWSAASRWAVGVTVCRCFAMGCAKLGRAVYSGRENGQKHRPGHPGRGSSAAIRAGQERGNRVKRRG